MKINATKTELHRALKQVSGAISTNSSIPVLSMVLLRADGGKLTLTGCNLDMQIEAQIDVSVDQSGVVALPFNRLQCLVGALGAESIAIAVSDKHVASITAGGASCSLFGLSPNEFQKIKAGDAKSFTIPQSKLAAMIRKVICAASDESTRPTLNGAYVTTKASEVQIVSTNGRFMSVASEACGEIEDCDFILPTRAANEASRLFDSESDMTVEVSENCVAFKTNRISLLSKRIAGHYPNFQSVVPREFPSEFQIEREVALETLKRATVMSDDGSDHKRVEVRIRKNAVDFEGGGKAGSVVESVAVRHDGKPVDFALNAVFLLRVLSSLTDDTVTFSFIDNLSPLKISALGFYAIVMPMRQS